MVSFLVLSFISRSLSFSSLHCIKHVSFSELFVFPPEFPPFDITVNSSVYIGFCLLWKPAEYRGPNGTFGTVQTGLIDFSSMFFNHWPTGRCLPVN